MVAGAMPRLVVFDPEPQQSVGSELITLLQRGGRYRAEFSKGEGTWTGDETPHLFLPILSRPSGQAQRAIQTAPWSKVGVPILAVVKEEALNGLLECGELGVRDFLVAPLRESEVFARVERLLRRDRDLPQRLSGACGVAQLIGEAPAFVELRRKIPLVAGFGSTVLLTGETGTGKERCARALHYSSRRAEEPFLPVNCGAIPVELFESELYGHQRGAFTGAIVAHSGLIAEADGGTLFLDEIETLTIASQVKLLRFLQDQTYYSLGSARQKQADVWIIASSNVDLPRKSKDASFREDLYYRLAVVNLSLPPLRERRSDIRLLANHFLKFYAQKHSLPGRQFSPQALEDLSQYDWPGNVRELENMVQQVLVLTESPVIDSRDLPIERTVVRTAGRTTFQQSKAEAIAQFERQYVTDLLRTHYGNVTQAGLAAGKERRALGRLIKKYQLKSSLTSRPGPGRL
jgi:two-component system, NtrC family, response regulator GlrR